MLKTLGESEDKPLPQPQISGICSMTPDAFVREYVHGSGSVIGLKVYAGCEEFILCRADFTKDDMHLTRVNLEFMKKLTESPDYFYQIKRNNNVNVELVEEVWM